MDARSRGAATQARPNFNTLYYLAAAAATISLADHQNELPPPPNPPTHMRSYMCSSLDAVLQNVRVLCMKLLFQTCR